MTWFTWRQHRVEAIIGSIILLLIVILIIVTGLNLRTLYDQMGVAKCVQPSPQCFQTLANFNQQAITKAFGNPAFYNFFLMSLLILPLLIGLFLGAPAGARELEQGTYRVVWTQGIPWQRWLSAKIILLTAATFSVFMVLFLLLVWWGIPLANVVNTVWSFYDMRGIVLPAYAIFAFILGFTSGILVRRTVPAMAIALIIFTLLRIGIEIFWRPFFLPPLHLVFSASATNIQIPAQSWVINSDIIDLHGNTVSNTNVCSTAVQYGQCMDKHGFRINTTYQPESRMWLFQAFESIIYLLLSGGLVVLAYWWIKHKIL